MYPDTNLLITHVSYLKFSSEAHSFKIVFVFSTFKKNPKKQSQVKNARAWQFNLMGVIAIGWRKNNDIKIHDLMLDVLKK